LEGPSGWVDLVLGADNRDRASFAWEHHQEDFLVENLRRGVVLQEICRSVVETAVGKRILDGGDSGEILNSFPGLPRGKIPIEPQVKRSSLL